MGQQKPDKATGGSSFGEAGSTVCPEAGAQIIVPLPTSCHERESHMCPRCRHTYLYPTGGFLICSACGLAITEQALQHVSLRVRHRTPAGLGEVIVVSSPESEDLPGT